MSGSLYAYNFYVHIRYLYTFLDHKIDIILSWVDYFCLWLSQSFEEMAETTLMSSQYVKWTHSKTYSIAIVNSIPALTCLWVQQCLLLKLS